MNRAIAASILDEMDKTPRTIYAQLMGEISGQSKLLEMSIETKNKRVPRKAPKTISIDVTKKEILTHAEAAALTGLSASHLYTLASKGTIPHTKGKGTTGARGNRSYYRRSDLEAYMLSYTTTLDEDQTTEIALKMLTAEFVADAASKKTKS